MFAASVRQSISVCCAFCIHLRWSGGQKTVLFEMSVFFLLFFLLWSGFHSKRGRWGVRTNRLGQPKKEEKKLTLPTNDARVTLQQTMCFFDEFFRPKNALFLLKNKNEKYKASCSLYFWDAKSSPKNMGSRCRDVRNTTWNGDPNGGHFSSYPIPHAICGLIIVILAVHYFLLLIIILAVMRCCTICAFFLIRLARPTFKVQHIALATIIFYLPLKYAMLLTKKNYNKPFKRRLLSLWSGHTSAPSIKRRKSKIKDSWNFFLLFLIRLLATTFYSTVHCTVPLQYYLLWRLPLPSILLPSCSSLFQTKSFLEKKSRTQQQPHS